MTVNLNIMMMMQRRLGYVSVSDCDAAAAPLA